MSSVQDRAAGLKQQLAAGETLLGCFLSLGSALTAEMMGAAGFDAAVIDLEHGAGNEQDALHQMQALAATGCAAIVRVESTERQRVHRVLDAGAHGIMFPRIDSPEQAAAAVAAMRYAPAGVRGVASSTRACEYGVNFRPYLAGVPHLLTIIQIESPAALACVEEIAAVDGVDILFVGPWDLSFAMGILGEFERPEFTAAIERTAAAAAAHGKQAGLLLPAGVPLATYHRQGYRFLVSGSDAVLLNQAARQLAQSMRSQRETLT